MTAALAAGFAALPWLLPAFAFVVGAAVGSFLNVVIIRLPAGESVVRPRSHCACGQAIAWRDNIPILSWILLRGRARCCGRPFSVRYPLIEALTGLIFLVCARRFELPVMLCGWVFLSALIAATFIDLDTLIIPDAFTIGLAIVGLALSILVPALHGEHSGYYALDSFRSAVDALEGVLLGSGIVLWIALIGGAILKKEALGFGDVKFVGAIGAFCGWHGALFALFGGALAGTLWILLALLATAIRGGRGAPAALRPPTIPSEPASQPTATSPPAPISPSDGGPLAPAGGPAQSADRKLGFGTQVPFGPMLAFAAALYFLFARAPVDAWFARFADLF